jgi:peptidyl-prolyl cis-trans isomerase B (cyclophilin B)
MKNFLAGVVFVLLAQFSAAGQTKKPGPKKPVASSVAKVGATKETQANLAAETERLVEISTPYGIMVAKLYNATPRHRDNFLKLVAEGFYDSLLFHRVIDQFMLQGGDPSSKNARMGKMLGMGARAGERIAAEFNQNFYHKKGALAAARDNNSMKSSSNCQFYIVDGKKATDPDLEKTKQNNPDFLYTPQQVDVYKRIGGTPFLDQNYTVFGEVISGIDVIDKIARVQVDENNRPTADVMMKIRRLN